MNNNVECQVCHKDVDMDSCFRFRPKHQPKGVTINANLWVCEDCHEDMLEKSHG